jgi:hypothetical protein
MSLSLADARRIAHGKEFPLMKRPVAIAGSAALALGLVVGGGLTLTPVDASSHHEAPSISTDPVADNSDVYAFVSPDTPSTVTLVANYIPLQNPAGGPTFFSFGDDVLYSINVDNVGDGKGSHPVSGPIQDADSYAPSRARNPDNQLARQRPGYDARHLSTKNNAT